MSIYAIGDIQGCYRHLMLLLDKIKFDPSKDRLWFAGDLVNRGPESLHTLRFIKSLGSSAVTVLGNHDFHLLALSAGNYKYLKKSDSLKQILQAKDRAELMFWLRQQKILHVDNKLNYSMAHAGIYPLWSLKKAQKKARKVEKVLRGTDYKFLLKHMYGNIPDQWQKNAPKIDKLRFIINTFVRMRFVRLDGGLEFDNKSNISQHNRKLFAWFYHPEHKVLNRKILFGHWSTLTKHRYGNVYSLDTGCVWGGKLTALEIDKVPPVWHSVKCRKD